MKKKLLLLIGFFGLLKLLAHLLTSTNYGLHRDEFLYWDEGRHLDWGFMEVPPFTPFVAWFNSALFGDSVFALRLFPALVGTVTILMIGWLIRDLGGKFWAIVFGCSGFMLSLVYLRSSLLFQPVVFNQFFWFLTAFLLIRLVKTADRKYWYFLGVVFGIGLLNKYSIAFYGLGLFIAFLLSKERKWLATPAPYLALFATLLIASPNIFWQYQHNWPVVHHMRELSETQLVNVNLAGFFGDQLLFHFAGIVVWLSGLAFLLSNKKYREYRFLAIAFLTTILIVALLRGKSYYTIGAYTVLFVFGGLALEQWILRKYQRIALLLLMVVLTIPILPFSLPVLKADKMKKYSQFMIDKVGLTAPLRWEDGNVYTLPQDYADMNGWEELAQKVSKYYHALPEERRKTCHIFGGSYGHAGSLNYYGKKLQLPEVHSFNGSYMIWTPNELQLDNQFLIDNVFQDSSTLFEKMTLIDSIENPYARDPGYIYYRSRPKTDLSKFWAEEVKEQKQVFNFK